MNCLSNIDRIVLDKSMMMKLISLYQYKGKDFYYEVIFNSDKDHIVRENVEKECVFLSNILKLDISENRRRLILKKESEPRTNDEKLLYNIKKIIAYLQVKVQDFELLPNEIMNLLKRLFKDIKDVSFGYEIQERQVNLLIEKQRVSKRSVLESMMKEYQRLINNEQNEIIMLAVSFYVDFINAKIFTEGNDTIGLIVLYMLLFRERFNMFKYESFFELVYENKAAFDDGLLQANFNYKEGYSQVLPLCKVIIDMMLQGYKKIDARVHEYEFDVMLNKSDNIENTVMKFPGQIFTKEEIRAKHPLVSDSTINRTLKRMRDENKIRPNGTGRSATWIRLVEVENFNPNIKQINLFELDEDDDDNKK